MKNIGIIINNKRVRSVKTLDKLNQLAKENSLDLFIIQNEFVDLIDSTLLTIEEFKSQAEIVIALGGDVTVLFSAANCRSP